MPLKTPSFWYRHASASAPLPEILLGALAVPYQWGHRVNQSMQSAKAKKAPVPVLCVGNAVAGGSGKTPIAQAIMHLIKKHDIAQTPYFLTRGYKGTLQEPTLVCPDHHSYAQSGDESLLLAKQAPTVIATKRIDGAELAALHGADVIIMDDGLQHAGLIKDLSFLVIDGQAGFGNLKTLPAGPLREPLEEAIDKADAFILIGKDKRGVTNLLPEQKPLFHAHIEPVQSSLPEKGPIVAFAGLGRPEKFYHFLQDMGYSIAAWHPFPDHHNYSDDELDALITQAGALQAKLVTTDKDFMRLKDHNQAGHVHPVQIRAVFSPESEISGFLKDRLS